MNDKIKKSYEKINISEEAKNRINTAIIMDEAGKYDKRKIGVNGSWRIAVAACLAAALVVPTGVYAAHKIYQHFTASVSTEKYCVDMKLKKVKGEGENSKEGNIQQYINVTADFGDDYIPEKGVEGELDNADGKGAWVGYSHKDGFYSGKCFWYQLEYMDENQDEILSAYDVEAYEQMTINNRKAVYCRYNDVVNSQYSKEHATDYGQSIYIFVEDYGYIIEMAAQKGLEKADFIKLAEKIQISPATSAEDASDFVLYSNRQKAAWNCVNDDLIVQEIDADNFYTDGEAEVGKTSVKLKDVQILDSVDTLQSDAFIYNHFNKKIVDKNGKIKKYDREKIKYGDGVTEPNALVEKTEKIQPKLVYVTIEVDNPKHIMDKEDYQVPSLELISKKSGKLYKADEHYNRPKYIDDAFTDNMPCYFEESLGGKSAWFAKNTGDKMTLHFAYLIDEDLTDGMALVLNDWVSSEESLIYLDISQK